MSVKLDISRNSKESHTIFKIDFFLNIIFNQKKWNVKKMFLTIKSIVKSLWIKHKKETFITFTRS